MSIRTQRSSTRYGAAAIAAVLLASIFAFANPASAAADVTRYGGSDRYETAALAALDTFGPASSNDIVLASGENFPDALAGAYLAGAADAPMLLTTRDALPASSANAMGSLRGAGVTTVHVLGGLNAIGQGVRNSLTALGYTVNGIGGATRYDTAQNVAAAANTLAGVGTFQGDRTAIVVTGENFPDALSAGPLSYAGMHPVILTTGGALSTQADTTLTNLNIQQAIVLGGTVAVSAGVVTAIEAKGIDVVRVSGANRFGTAAALAGVLTTPEISGGAGWDGMEAVLAYGLNFPDALAAAQVGGTELAPILLTGSVPVDTCNALGAIGQTLEDLFVMGGTAAISAETLAEAQTCASAEVPTATITALDGRTTFTVQFSAPVINSTNLANYNVNNSGATVLSVTPGAAGSNTVTVSLSAALVPNDLITVNPSPGSATSIRTGAGGVVALTNFTVPEDNTRPTVLLARFYDGQTQGWLFFSEGVEYAPGMDFTDIEVGGDPATGDLFLGPTARRITLGSAAVGGESVQIPEGTFQDFADDPNTNPAFSTQVLTDNAAPTLLSATRTTSQYYDTPGDPTTARVAVLDIGQIEIVARTTGVAAGHVGNLWEVYSTETPGVTGVTVQVNTNTRRINIGAADLNNVGTVALINALAANPTFNANFFTQLTGGGPVEDISWFEGEANSEPLTDGLSNVRIVTQWSEQLRPFGLGSTLTGAALVPSVPGASINAGTDAAAPFLGQYVLSYVSNGLAAGGDSDGPLATQIVPPAGTIQDLATNGNAATAANITAG